MKHILPAVGVMLALPGLALAQAAAPTKDKEAVEYNEIERGVNVGVGGGPYMLFSAPKGGPFSFGQLARVEAGYDFGERVSVELFLMGTANRATSSYLGAATTANPAAGDFAALIPGLSARVNIVGLADAQEVKRLWVYAKAGAGYAIFQPSA